MPVIDMVQMDTLRKQWIDQYVSVNPAKADLKRFEGRFGRVITVNYGGKAIVDFADGAWYDIPATPEHLTIVSPVEASKNYDAGRNSAQAHPERQG